MYEMRFEEKNFFYFRAAARRDGNDLSNFDEKADFFAVDEQDGG